MNRESMSGYRVDARQGEQMETTEQKMARLAGLKAELLCVEGTPTEVYSRIVGYYRSVRNWNAGKREEFRSRTGYSFLPGADRRSGNLSSYVLFTRQTCPNCPAVKEYLSSSGLPGTLVDVDTDAGLDTARRFEVLSTPTAILLGDDGEERCRAYTKQQLVALLASGAASVASPASALQPA